MPVVPVRDLVGGGGANLDVSPDDLPMNSFNNIINGRFSRNRIERFGGNELYQDPTTNPEVANGTTIWNIIRNGVEGFLLTTSTTVLIDIGAGYVDVTPTAGIVNSNEWLMEQYGDWIILTTIEGNQEPIVLDPTGGVFEPFTNWRPGFQAAKIFGYKNFLVAIGIELNNNPENGLVFWSDVVNEDILQDVAWDPADPTSLAGENVLPSFDGLIRDAGVLRDSGILYTDTSVWRMDPTNATAGAFPLVFNFRIIFQDDGILDARCWEEVNGRHYVVGIYDIYIHDGFNKQSISDNRVTEFFFDRIGTSTFAFMAHYQRPQEIIISYSSRGASVADEALIYNYFYGTWTRFVIGDTAGQYSHLILAPEFVNNVQSWADAQVDNTQWSDVNNSSWDSLFPQNRNRIPYVLVPSTSSIFFIDRNTTASMSVDLFIERLDLDLDEVFNKNRSIKHIKRFMPQARGDGEITIQFGGRNALGEQIVWDTERVYNLITDYKFDLRISYRYPAFRIRQGTNGNALTLTGYDIEVMEVSFR